MQVILFNSCTKDIMELKTMKGLALDDILAEVHTYVHRGKYSCGSHKLTKYLNCSSPMYT